MAKDAYYFPHYNIARKDRRLLRAQKELGIEGYAIYFMTLEVLRGEEDFKYPLGDIDLLADDFNTSEQKVRTLVCNYGLFQDDGKYFWSDRFIEYLEPYIYAKDKRSVDGIKGNLIRYGYLTKEEADEMSNDQLIEFNKNRRASGASRKAIAIKLKEIKLEEKKVNNTYKEIFDYYLTLSLVKHKKYTKSMQKAIKSFMDKTKSNVYDCKLALYNHSLIVHKTQDLKFPVKRRELDVFFGQKVHNGLQLIAEQYINGGKYSEPVNYEQQNVNDDTYFDPKLSLLSNPDLLKDE